jgi:hypothetical protein
MLIFVIKLVYAPKFGGAARFCPGCWGFYLFEGPMVYVIAFASEGRYDCQVLANFRKDIKKCNINTGVRSRMRNQ